MFTSNVVHTPVRAVLLGSIAMLFSTAAGAVPDFSSGNMGWAGNGGIFLPVPGEKYVPIANDPEHPYCGNRIMPQCGNVVLPRIADTKNPVLQPWAAKQMETSNNDVLSGRAQPFNPMSRCWPGGIPGMMTFTAEPTYYLQMPAEVTMLYARGPNIRHIYMNVPHTDHPALSWYGESVGHYDGEEFVVDTIGLNDKTFIDSWRTPHTTLLHVVERYKLIPKGEIVGDGGKVRETGPMLQGIAEVEDPGTFTAPWKGLRTFIKHNEPIAESENICAENNDNNYFGEDEVPVPQSKTPDF